MDETPAPNPIKSLIEGIRFLSALQAQLEQKGDADARGVREYGNMIPYLPLDHLGGDEASRIRGEVESSDSAAAGDIQYFLLPKIRELLERHERSRTVVEPRLLHWYIGAPYLQEADLVAALVDYQIPVRPLWHAMRLARSVHDTQTRDDGSFYLEEHVFPLTHEVVRYCWIRQQPVETRIDCALTALLHDSLEDSSDPESQDVLIRHFVGEGIAAFVRTLTKRPKSDFAHLPPAEAKLAREAEYMQRVAEAPYQARLVKVLDRINNLLCVHKSPDKIEGYIEETIRYHVPLAATIDTELVEEMRYVIQALERRLEDMRLYEDDEPAADGDDDLDD